MASCLALCWNILLEALVQLLPASTAAVHMQPHQQ
jgi:hypothetical protein